MVAVAAVGALAVDAVAQHLWSMLDLQVYHWAGAVAWHRPDVYDLHTQHDLWFTYTPMALVIFMVAALLPFPAEVGAVIAATVVALALSAWLALGIAGYRRGAGRTGLALLVVAPALWLEPLEHTLALGQLNVLLMLVVVADLALPTASRLRGAGIGLAAGFKLTPTIFIGYLLVTRQWRAAAVAAGTFAATVLAGFAILPTESQHFWLGRLFSDPGRTGPPDFAGNQSLNGLLSRILQTSRHGVNPLWLGAAAVVAVGGLALAAWTHHQGEELLAVGATALTGLLVSPISWSHHWVWIVVWLAALIDIAVRRRSRLAWGVVTLLTAAFFAYPIQLPYQPVVPKGLLWTVPYYNNREWAWHGAQLLIGNLYIWIGLALLLALAGYLAVRRRHALATPAATHQGREKGTNRIAAAGMGPG